MTMTMEMMECVPDAGGIADQVVGWVITVGSFLSFIPQMYSLVKRKSPDGLSGVSWTMNYISNLGTTVNVFFLRWHQSMCCHVLTVQQCSVNLLPVVQLAAPWLAVLVIFIILAKYSKYPTPPTSPYSSYNNEHASLISKSPPPQTRMDKIVDIIFLNNEFVVQLLIMSFVVTIAAAGVGVILVYHYGETSRQLVLYAQVWGVFALLLLVVQYIPQIYTTHKKKEAGSLSVATLLLQAPGALAVVYFQAFMNHGSWTTWAPYLCTAIQQFFLAGQCGVYYFIKWRAGRRGEQHTIQSVY
jgi:uncharacterized protein with PQ loop repeat